ncbi:hypothetical protein HAX54_046271 [Datura stramonium]|uniref:Uncharacterized protein n=1 Tax=Datura stramonium TaxID=4076 RepID=A0ABS8WKP5_DATST|nr:hypothetical protein [Datura stramonium]
MNAKELPLSLSDAHQKNIKSETKKCFLTSSEVIVLGPQAPLAMCCGQYSLLQKFQNLVDGFFSAYNPREYRLQGASPPFPGLLSRLFIQRRTDCSFTFWGSICNDMNKSSKILSSAGVWRKSQFCGREWDLL